MTGRLRSRDSSASSASVGRNYSHGDKNVRDIAEKMHGRSQVSRKGNVCFVGLNPAFLLPVCFVLACCLSCNKDSTAFVTQKVSA